MCIRVNYRGSFQDPIGTLSPKGVPTMHWFSQATADGRDEPYPNGPGPECPRALHVYHSGQLLGTSPPAAAAQQRQFTPENTTGNAQNDDNESTIGRIHVVQSLFP